LPITQSRVIGVLNDLKLRLKEDWFDEKGFFIAEKHNQMIGFHLDQDFMAQRVTST
jgi:hypothetical protein